VAQAHIQVENYCDEDYLMHASYTYFNEKKKENKKMVISREQNTKHTHEFYNKCV